MLLFFACVRQSREVFGCYKLSHVPGVLLNGLFPEIAVIRESNRYAFMKNISSSGVLNAFLGAG